MNLEDFLRQIRQVKKMGPLNDLIKKIPGFSKVMPKDRYIDEDELKYTEAIVRSMTPQERRNPKIINGGRRRRIANGSGTSIWDVNHLLEDFERFNRLPPFNSAS